MFPALVLRIVRAPRVLVSRHPRASAHPFTPPANLPRAAFALASFALLALSRLRLQCLFAHRVALALPSRFHGACVARTSCFLRTYRAPSSIAPPSRSPSRAILRYLPAPVALASRLPPAAPSPSRTPGAPQAPAAHFLRSFSARLQRARGFCRRHDEAIPRVDRAQRWRRSVW